MMVDLKTLKELEDPIKKEEVQKYFESYPDLSKYGSLHGVLSEVLRAEAVKWIKELSEEKKLTFGNVTIECEDPKIESHRVILVSWITHVFNISEEDLK